MRPVSERGSYDAMFVRSYTTYVFDSLLAQDSALGREISIPMGVYKGVQALVALRLLRTSRYSTCLVVPGGYEELRCAGEIGPWLAYGSCHGTKSLGLPRRDQVPYSTGFSVQAFTNGPSNATG